jgi:hypothetical protein
LQDCGNGATVGVSGAVSSAAANLAERGAGTQLLLALLILLLLLFLMVLLLVMILLFSFLCCCLSF